MQEINQRQLRAEIKGQTSKDGPHENKKLVEQSANSVLNITSVDASASLYPHLPINLINLVKENPWG